MGKSRGDSMAPAVGCVDRSASKQSSSHWATGRVLLEVISSPTWHNS